MCNQSSKTIIRDLFNCPQCGSSDVARKYYNQVSYYGHLPKSPKDVCRLCGFQHVDFYNLNLQKLRHKKILQILEDGI
jgi:C4-type Zn-finger protein